MTNLSRAHAEDFKQNIIHCRTGSVAAPFLRSTCSQAHHAWTSCKLRNCPFFNTDTSRLLTLGSNPWICTTWAEKSCLKKAEGSRLGVSNPDAPPTLPNTTATAHSSTAVHNHSSRPAAHLLATTCSSIQHCFTYCQDRQDRQANLSASCLKCCHHYNLASRTPSHPHSVFPRFDPGDLAVHTAVLRPCTHSLQLAVHKLSHHVLSHTGWPARCSSTTWPASSTVQTAPYIHAVMQGMLRSTCTKTESGAALRVPGALHGTCPPTADGRCF
jgi:hypothetical protein